MRIWSFTVLIAISLSAHADLTIFDVRRTLPLADSETVYRDFYINGGSESGLNTGMILTVHRRLPLYDTYQNRSAGDLQLKVAKVKIIHVQKGLAVGRLHSEFTRDQAPLLEDNFVMVGDRVDVATATSEKGDKKSEANSHTPTAAQAEPSPPPITKQAAQITVNAVDLSSEAPQLKPDPGPQEPPRLPTPQ